MNSVMVNLACYITSDLFFNGQFSICAYTKIGNHVTNPRTDHSTMQCVECIPHRLLTQLILIKQIITQALWTIGLFEFKIS